MFALHAEQLTHHGWNLRRTHDTNTPALTQDKPTASRPSRTHHFETVHQLDTPATIPTYTSFFPNGEEEASGEDGYDHRSKSYDSFSLIAQRFIPGRHRPYFLSRSRHRASDPPLNHILPPDAPITRSAQGFLSQSSEASPY